MYKMVEDEELNNVVCPYCGYRMPMQYGLITEVDGVLLKCKGRNCKKKFMLKISKGRQENLVPDERTVEAFRKVYGEDYKLHLFDSFGVFL